MKIKIIIYMFLAFGFITSCDENGNDFSSSPDKVTKEKNSTEAEDESSVAPEMISGAFLACDWTSSQFSAGYCRMQDSSSGKKLDIGQIWGEEVWDVGVKEGNAYEKLSDNSVNKLPKEDYWHIKFDLPPQKKGKNVSITFNNEFTKLLTGELNESTKEAILAQNLHIINFLNLQISFPSNISEKDKKIYFWPNPYFKIKITEEAFRDPIGSNAAHAFEISQEFYDGFIFGTKTAFDPLDFLGSEGVLNNISSKLATTLGNINSQIPVGMRNEIVPLREGTKLNIQANADCIDPLYSQQGRTAKSSNGRYYFFLLKKFVPWVAERSNENFVIYNASPTLVIIPKAYSDAAGVTFNDLDDAARVFTCY